MGSASTTLAYHAKGGKSDSATLLHLFKGILKLNEDSHPIKALAQGGYMDMPGFLSIPYERFPEFVAQETIEQMVGGQISGALVSKRLEKISHWSCAKPCKMALPPNGSKWQTVDQ